MQIKNLDLNKFGSEIVYIFIHNIKENTFLTKIILVKINTLTSLKKMFFSLN